jgi:hypothetical protein
MLRPPFLGFFVFPCSKTGLPERFPEKTRPPTPIRPINTVLIKFSVGQRD